METLIDTGKSQLLRFPRFIPNDKLINYTSIALKLPLIEKPEIFIFGKVCHQQRNVGFFAHSDVPGYRYSGSQTSVINIENYPFLQEILENVNTKLQSEYNGILINLYENGENYISAHSDDEKDLAPIGVASIAFGAIRTFRIRDKVSKKIICDVLHQPGDLLLMAGDFQKEFTHEIPIQKKIKIPRISLTFRYHQQ